MRTDPQLLTVEQVAERLQISLSLVYREIPSGRLLSHRFGKRYYRVSEENLEIYVREHLSPGYVVRQPSQSSANQSKRVSSLRHLRINLPPCSRN